MAIVKDLIVLGNANVTGPATVSSLSVTTINGVTVGSSPKFTDNNTTYSFSSGSTNGAFSVTPSGGSATTVYVKGLDSAAYCASNSFATAGHNHSGVYSTVAHAHGQITSDGKITTSVSIANNDRLVIMDADGSNVIKTSTIAFDGTTTTSFLSKKGTWETVSTGTDEKQKIASSTAKTYLTGITTAPTASEVAYKGVANTSVYMTNGVLNVEELHIKENGYGGKLTFGDGDNCYITKYGSTDTDAMEIYTGSADGIYFNTDSEVVRLYREYGKTLLNHNRDSDNEFQVSCDDTNAYLELNGRQCWSKIGADDGDAYILVDGDGTETGNDCGIVMHLHGEGNIVLDPTYGVVQVTTRVNAVNGFFQTSDERQKNIISDISLDKVYDLIDKCQTIIYTLKDDKSNKEQIGMIAQEIQEFFPEIITEDKDGMLSLDYSRLTVIIFKVLKDLIKRIEKLEKQN